MSITSDLLNTPRKGARTFVAIVAAAFGSCLASAGTPTYRWSHLAGTLGGPGSTDGTGSEARFGSPNAAAVDASGNVYVADTNSHTIRKIATGGVVTTLAGAAGVRGSADGVGSAATFAYPQGIAVDGSGNVFVADTANYTIRKITPGGVVTTIAGSPGSSGSADGTGSAARFAYPKGIAVDGGGNILVADYTNHTIRKVTPGGEVTTIAGSAGLSGSTDGTGNAARFNIPEGVAVDGSGNVFVSDRGNRTIRKITPSAVVTTFAATAGGFGSADGAASSARFAGPAGIAVDGSGTVFVADSNNHTIRRITSDGVVSTLAGSAQAFGFIDGTGAAARFYLPQGVAVDGSGNVYVADPFNSTIRKVTPGGVVTSIAGAAAEYGSVDGTGSAARFSSPQRLAVDASGNVYVADTSNHTIRKITPEGVVTTIAGAAGVIGSADGTGSSARFYFPSGVAVSGAGDVFVADTNNQTIRKITSGGVVTTFAGSAGQYGSADGAGSGARFNSPRGVTVDGSGNVFVADNFNQTIRKITPGGVVTTIAGSPGPFGSADGTGSGARFRYPRGVAVDGSGSIFVADTENHLIRKISAGGVVTTLAGSVGTQGSADGSGIGASFNFPSSLVLDGVGNLFIADTFNSLIRHMTPSGRVTTLAGSPGVFGSSNGSGRATRFSSPGGIGMDASGNLYVADSGNHCIRKGQRIGKSNAFSALGTTDLLWQNTATGDRGIWRMAGTAFSSWTSLGNVSTDWRIAANADFNGDGSTDLLWENTSTGDRYFWFLTNGVYLDGGYFVNVPPAWRIAGAADFNGDTHADILWENTSTGDHVAWFMNGTTYSDYAYVGNASTVWRVAAVADFNGDGGPDLLWENTASGNRALWLMNGARYSSSADLGVISTDWRIAGAGDFNDDGSSDIVWENTTTGDRVAWLMNGTTYASSAQLGNVAPSWGIRN